MANFKDIISDVVTNVRTDYDTVNTPVVFPVYDYGHSKNVANRIMERVKSNTYKGKILPMIALITNPDDIIEGVSDINYTASGFSIFILNERLKTWTEEQAYDNNFDTVLTPIYNLLIKYLKRSSYIDGSSVDTGQRINRPYLGSLGANANPFNIAIDAIEIRNLNLEILKKC